MGQIIDMQLQAKQDEQIDRYLRNEMTADEVASFEAALKRDASLRSRARFVAQTVKALQQIDERGEALTPSAGFRMVARNPLASKKPKK